MFISIHLQQNGAFQRLWVSSEAWLAFRPFEEGVLSPTAHRPDMLRLQHLGSIPHFASRAQRRRI